jgi:hypothetical protein
MNRKTQHICLIILGMLILNISCSRNAYQQKKKKLNDIVIFPSPPDTARIQFLTKITNSGDIVKKRSAFMRLVLGEQEETKQIQKPYGIFIHNGKLYICDQGLGGLEIIDLEYRTFEQFIPKGKGELKLPLNCFVDENDFLYVADGERHEVVIFDEVGNYVNSFSPSEKFKPTDVFVYGKKIFVPDCNNNKVYIYDRITLRMLDYFPKAEKGTHEFLYSPTNVYITPAKIYVTDMGDYRVKMYTHDGKFLTSIGSYGTQPSQFLRPKGIAVDRESNLYVIDAGFENAQVFNDEGKLLMFFGGPYQGPGYMWLPAKISIDYNNLKYFSKYVDPSFELKYLILVTNQYGPDKISIYGAIKSKK